MELVVALNERRGITVVIVTHEPEIASFAPRRVVFRDGLIERDERGGEPA
jgi:putative ABC transport system ATP-binding protein